jgi:type IV pilus assembly protein PilA
MRKQKGFSLIELLIVVAIILIIAAIAIPSLLRARMSANDSGAASTIRTLNTAQVSYATNYATLGFADTLVKLGPNTAPPACDPTGACLIDNVLACGTGGSTGCQKSGYNFFLIGAAAVGTVVPNYAASASPINVNTTGTNDYCSTADAVVRSWKNSIPAPATGTSAPLLSAPETIVNCQTVTAYGPIQ